jgi:hypothetical protein
LGRFLHRQIYVEIERARLTKRLAKIEEEKGNVSEAADILQEVAVVRLLVHSAVSRDI